MRLFQFVDSCIVAASLSQELEIVEKVHRMTVSWMLRWKSALNLNRSSNGFDYNDRCWMERNIKQNTDPFSHTNIYNTHKYAVVFIIILPHK